MRPFVWCQAVLRVVLMLLKTCGSEEELEKCSHKEWDMDTCNTAFLVETASLLTKFVEDTISSEEITSMMLVKEARPGTSKIRQCCVAQLGVGGTSKVRQCCVAQLGVRGRALGSHGGVRSVCWTPGPRGDRCGQIAPMIHQILIHCPDLSISHPSLNWRAGQQHLRTLGPY